jgi:DNA polymerase-3 subunit delta
VKDTPVSWRKAAPAPVVLFFGPQQYLAGRAIRAVRDQLTAKLGSIEVERVAASDYTAGQINNLAAPSLFAQPKLIIIEGVEKCSDDLITDGVAYLANPEPDVTLILVHDGSSVRGKKLLEAIRASNKAVEYALPKADAKFVQAFVAEEFQLAGRQVQPQAIRAIADAFGDSLAEAAAACEQLIQDIEGNITEAIVDQYYGGRVEVSIFKLMDAAWAGQKTQAIEYLRHTLGNGSDKVMLVAGIAKQVREVAKVYANRNVTIPYLNQWQVDHRRKAGAGWNEEGMAKLVNACADADAASKGASRDPEYVIEQLILLIANKGR